MRDILGVHVGGQSYSETTKQCVAWAQKGESRAVFFANVHVIMEAFDDHSFRTQLNEADLVNPDGMPLVWALRFLGEPSATRVYGPDTTTALLHDAEQAGLPVGFYGGSPSTLEALQIAVRRAFPTLKITYSFSPPFRALTPEEDEQIVSDITASGAKMLFIGLGCPKQEHWCMAHRGRIPAVMLAVGAAFDFLANTKPQAPRWIMRSGLEWLFRLGSEPRRLVGRYLKHNPRFVALFFLQWMGNRKRVSPA